ncbi:DUF6193 family natural product biosynthesis protein [Streptomyces sp. NPDC005969]|uniref:DUF6193 family natural product biosynthesis protein n=1 Tax=Streptomyces sp. NPDC005969 TaxID=3156722 RepID=UPI0033FDBAD1
MAGVRPPAEAAHSEPRLRQLYPLSSRWMLCFSGCTGFPCAVQAAPSSRRRRAATATAPVPSHVRARRDDPGRGGSREPISTPAMPSRTRKYSVLHSLQRCRGWHPVGQDLVHAITRRRHLRINGFLTRRNRAHPHH